MNYSIEHAARWAGQHLVDPVHIDCTTTVMLKILDGKCKMNEHDKVVIGCLYDVVKNRPGKLIGEEYHALIEQARTAMDEALAMFIYEKRLLAETMISRPVMKAYKAWLRDNGILCRPQDAEEA
ncbi:hypothetical protein AT959_01450 [Dechloromonas denitrificans]|uniref:Uncharacterized protein n=1 Tax=Dechloromonas denitrificans TaxID=281362 RepID=A0A133XN68_9RHOO|nr:hypothetical protein [Dechloromonas denitrificans]KXB32385.1 hypothetical protein AT959_01450 [Dechloromonas denitrificans]